MLSRVARFLAIVFLLLCLALAALWIRSLRVADQINFSTNRGWRGALDTRFIFSSSGTLDLGRHRILMSDDVREAFGPDLSFPGASQDAPRSLYLRGKPGGYPKVARFSDPEIVSSTSSSARRFLGIVIEKMRIAHAIPVTPAMNAPVGTTQITLVVLPYPLLILLGAVGAVWWWTHPLILRIVRSALGTLRSHDGKFSTPRVAAALITLASVLLGVAVAVLSGYSYRAGPSFEFSWAKQRFELVAVQGRLKLTNNPQIRLIQAQHAARARKLDTKLEPLRALYRAKSDRLLGAMFFEPGKRETYMRELAQIRQQEAQLERAEPSPPPIPPEFRRSVGMWAPISVFAVPPAASLIGATLLLVRRWKRRRHMQCVACGYDLRAGHDCCPECGTPVVPARLVGTH